MRSYRSLSILLFVRQSPFGRKIIRNTTEILSDFTAFTYIYILWNLDFTKYEICFEEKKLNKLTADKFFSRPSPKAGRELQIDRMMRMMREGLREP